jgi:transcriptional regulator of acetoin/glycerol metabolism
MTRAAAAEHPVLAEGSTLAKARERFLTAQPVAPNQVREAILASWWRSRQSNVAADHIEMNYVRDPDLDTPLTRNALPVLRDLYEYLKGQPVSLILTDASGVVLARMTGDHDLERHLDGVKLAPGFSYSEDAVGTNGIGTALEVGRSAYVFGHEHYAEYLEDLACAGVPIQHPVSGKTIGAVDLTCWRKDADSLLIALVNTTADQITRAILDDSSAREVRLMQEYLRACRHTTGIVLALSNDMVMMNEYARQVLGPGDQAALVGQAADVMSSHHTDAVAVELPSGLRARLYCRPVHGADQMAGGVVHVKLLEPAIRAAPEAVTAAKTPMFLPGLVGSGPLWLRVCRQVETVYDSGEWLALDGEPGVGKLALVRAVHQRRNPAGRFHVLEAAEATGQDWLVRMRRELADGDGSLVIRHVDQLNARQLNALSNALHEARSADPRPALWVAVTLGLGAQDENLVKLLRSFPSTVELPPLRHHIEDLNELVPFFLAKLGRHGRLACSPEAMQLLLRSSWPGNAKQLWQVLRKVVQHRRTGLIQPGDLPPECWTVSRRLLSPLESMERDAIVQSLLDHEGNKAKAAESLGMSRATIYRKIHEYGVVIPAS